MENQEIKITAYDMALRTKSLVTETNYGIAIDLDRIESLSLGDTTLTPKQVIDKFVEEGKLYYRGEIMSGLKQSGSTSPITNIGAIQKTMDERPVLDIAKEIYEWLITA